MTLRSTTWLGETWMKVGADRSSVDVNVQKMNALADAYTHGTNTSDAAFVACAVRYAILAEREACARIASATADGSDCDNRGAMDMETGEVPCAAERRGEVCTCAERFDLAHKIADKIRARK